MVSYKKIKELGEKFKADDKKTISTDELSRLLREETSSHRDKTIRHYIEILHDEKFITWIERDTWEIGRPKDEQIKKGS